MLSKALDYMLANEVIGWPSVGTLSEKIQRMKNGPESHWFTNSPHDTGGNTAFGMTLGLAEHYGVDSVEALRAISAEKITEIYKYEFWRFDGLKSDQVASKIFDSAVNMGLSTTIRVLQSKLAETGATIRADGRYGSQTEGIINQFEPTRMLNMLCAAFAQHYQNIVDQNPNQSVWLNGWLKRANRIPGV